MYIVPNLGNLGLGRVRRVEAAPSLANKFLWPLLRLAGVPFGSGKGLACCYLARSDGSFEDSDLVCECFCCFLVFFGIGDNVLSGEALGTYAYHYSEE